MSIAVLFDCSADTLAQYEKALELAPELARPCHMCVASGAGFSSSTSGNPKMRSPSSARSSVPCSVRSASSRRPT